MLQREPVPSSTRPNLLFVLVDQMRYAAMGCAGNEQIRTRNLDRLASEGVLFDNAVSNIPVCTPARACLLTGRYPLAHTTLTNNSMLPTDMPSIAKRLKREGYATGYIGKWHLAGEAFFGRTPFARAANGYIPPGPMRHGFDYWAVHHCAHDYWHAHYYRDTPDPVPIDGWEPDTQTDLAIDFIDGQIPADGGTRSPFALFVSWGPPHTPFTAPPEFLDLYPPDKLRLRGNVAVPPGGFTSSDSARPEASEGERVLREWTAAYYAAVTSLDHCLGRLLEALEQRGLARDTIVVFTSDHGEMLGSHGQLHKLQPWDESILIPLLVRYPSAVPAGRRLQTVFNLPDMLPTLFGLMGVPQPAGVQGEDLSPLLRGEREDDDPRSAFLVWPCSAVTWHKTWTHVADRGRGMPRGFMRPYRGVRTRTHTYVRHRQGPWFLYDNAADPLQIHNLVQEWGPSAVPPELDRLLDDWLQRTGDTFEDTQYYIDRIELETGRWIGPPIPGPDTATTGKSTP